MVKIKGVIEVGQFWRYRETDNGASGRGEMGVTCLNLKTIKNKHCFYLSLALNRSSLLLILKRFSLLLVLNSHPCCRSWPLLLVPCLEHSSSLLILYLSSLLLVLNTPPCCWSCIASFCRWSWPLLLVPGLKLLIVADLVPLLFFMVLYCSFLSLVLKRSYLLLVLNSHPCCWSWLLLFFAGLESLLLVAGLELFSLLLVLHTPPCG